VSEHSGGCCHHGGQEWLTVPHHLLRSAALLTSLKCLVYLVTPAPLVTSAWLTGGWLAGAALNQRPNLFCASVLTVAALDVLNTFNEDPSPGDSAELGDARGDPQVHRMVRALSPADNLPDPQVCFVQESFQLMQM
jgi:hypothetical protein